MGVTANEPRQTRRLPGVEGVWVFVAADMAMFGLLFVSFMLDRQKALALFEQSRHTLNFNFGGVNTLILLTSSWFMVLALDTVKRNQLARAPHYLAAAFVCGLAFGASKALEYSEKLSVGISMLSNDFYMYYFVLTGIHLLHVAAGCVVIGVLWKKTRAGAYDAKHCVGLECGATYWHMVDLLWIVLFPLRDLRR